MVTTITVKTILFDTNNNLTITTVDASPSHIHTNIIFIVNSPP